MASIYAYLEHQQPGDLQELYRSPWCCMAVYQSLPTAARHIVMRFLSIRTFIAESFVRCWFKDAPSRVVHDVDAALAKLQRLYILGSPGGAVVSALGLNGAEETGAALGINATYAEGLQRALADDEDAPWQGITNLLPPLRSPPSIKTIESVAGAKWNAILHFLLGTADAPMPDTAVVEVLVATGLLAPGADATAGFGSGDTVMDDNKGLLTVDPGFEPVSMRKGGGGKGGSSSSSSSGNGGGGAVMTWAEIIEAGDGDVHVTRDGYGFLLRSTSTQLWTFLDVYVRTAASRDQKTTDILALLFELGYTRPGHGYAVAALNEAQQRLLDDFAAFGLVYIPEDQEVELRAGESLEDYEAAGVSNLTRFFPTYLAITLTQPENEAGGGAGHGQGHGQPGAAGGGADEDAAAAGAGSSAPPPSGSGLDAALLASTAFADAASGGALQLESENNFKLYAYTRSGLHTAIVALFASIECLMPNLVVASITRKSAMSAFDKGITAEQVIGFLRAHRSPRMRAKGMPVPENVAGQLVLWQRERYRMASRGAVLLTGFASVVQFRDAVAFARSLRGASSSSSSAAGGEGEDGDADIGAGAGAGAGPAGSPASSAGGSSAAGAGAGAGQPGSSSQAWDGRPTVPMSATASGGLLWADEAKLTMVVRDGAYAEAVQKHLGVKEIVTG